ncbi:MAG TPA: hypothetical protein VEO37_11230, partial [Thermoanaerobaculia bacterium]|nr:hypothetical protein [Thermoanaerobaculia bacterium]
EAEACLQQSLALSRRQCAPGWELRGAMSLARVWQRAGRKGDAQTLLSPLVTQYQEGLSTRDLVAARGLLGSLN